MHLNMTLSCCSQNIHQKHFSLVLVLHRMSTYYTRTVLDLEAQKENFIYSIYLLLCLSFWYFTLCIGALRTCFSCDSFNDVFVNPSNLSPVLVCCVECQMFDVMAGGLFFLTVLSSKSWTRNRRTVSYGR